MATMTTLALVSLVLVTIAPAAIAQDRDQHARIVNGTPAELGEFPHQVLLLLEGAPQCGGSIVAPSTIVTAAHCFDAPQPEDGEEPVEDPQPLDDPAMFTIRAGVLASDDTSGQDRQVTRIVNHPDHDVLGVGRISPDVAVITLATPLTFNAAVAPIGLASAGDIVMGERAMVSGWGALNDDGVDYPENLLRADLTLVDDATCQASLQADQPGTTLDGPNELCASSSPSDSCYGDSGGPLTIDTATGARLAGVVSWGLSCGPPSPGIYVEVPNVAPWIIANASETLSGTLTNGAMPTATPTEVPNPNPTTCNNLAITVNLAAGDLPTAGDDVIAGTPGNDVIAAGAGNDTICGGGGDDTIWGQAGNDTILGEAGDDKLRGGDGEDTLLGGAGVDDLNGGRDNDMVNGGDGADLRVRGGTGDDLVDGGAGNDPLVAGNGGFDVVRGGAGNDKVTGGPRPDEVFGDAGNDDLRGHGGADTLDGGLGDDMLFGGKQRDDLIGGPGTDLCNGGTTGDGAIEDDLAFDCEGDLVNIP